MPLVIGTRVGPYEILSVIGTGGMGEVYRARDTTLGRDVAIKTLLPDVAGDPARLARFGREAQVLASLNHPNIAQVHGLDHSTGVRALVMELVEGPTLADRLTDGPLALEEALGIAGQLAEALDAAHTQGIIHRDLKPANIKVRTDGTVKVLDFGLAKALDPPPGSAAARALANLPTATGDATTRPGAILGTAPYMSPEQARGLPLDKRTDIWAFGCVLFEMLTGRPAFAGATASDVTAHVIGREPAWNALPAATPPAIRRLLRRALAKDRQQRLADIADAQLEIAEALALPARPSDAGPATAGRRVPRAALAAAVAAGALIAATIAWLLLRPSPAAGAPTLRFAIIPPPAPALDIQDNDRLFALSPNGRLLVYRSRGFTTGGPLMLRPSDRLDPQPLAGVTNARSPFFSPDGRWLAFFEGTAIKKIAIAGGPVTTICTIDGYPRGGSWGDDNSIVFATNDEATGLLRVSADGGTPTTLTTPDADRQEEDHLFPSVLPGGRGVLFTIATPHQHPPLQVAVLDGGRAPARS